MLRGFVLPLPLVLPLPHLFPLLHLHLPHPLSPSALGRLHSQYLDTASLLVP